MVKSVIRFFGLFLLLISFLGAGLFLLANQDKNINDEKISKYLRENMPIFVGWDFSKAKDLLSTQAYQSFTTPKGEKLYKTFSTLGKLKSFDIPVYEKISSDENHTYYYYEMLGHFENADALIETKLFKERDGYKIHYINFKSNFFFKK